MYMYMYIYVYIYVYIYIYILYIYICSRFVLSGLIGATEYVKSELHKSEVLLIISTVLVVKTENINRNSNKMHKTIETNLTR